MEIAEITAECVQVNLSFRKKNLVEYCRKYQFTRGNYVDSKYEVIKDADALVLLTEWKEFRSPDFVELKNQLKNPVIFDGRNQYNAFNLEEKGFEYFQIGK